MFTRQETQICLSLKSKILQYDKVLIILANHVNFVIGVLVLSLILLLVFVFIVFVTWGEREARIALVQVASALELFPKILLATIVLQILYKFMNYAAKTPEI